MKLKGLLVAGLLVTLFGLAEGYGAQARRARYLTLTAATDKPPPFKAVDFTRGPADSFRGKDGHWWQLEVRNDTAQTATPLFVLRALTVGAPPREVPQEFARYQLRIPATGEALEFVDGHTGWALVPAWEEFARHFVPRRTAASQWEHGLPQTCEYLGQVLTLREAAQESWEPWSAVKRLVLDRELLVGTGRNFKDQEGHRLAQKPRRQNYTYVPFERDDYRTMIEAGINLYTVEPRQEPYVRAEPVFYLRAVAGDPPLQYPTDLYRPNYLGPVMFMDEPSILMVGDKNVNTILQYFSDAAALIAKRTRATYLSSGSYGAFALEKALLARGINLGDMPLMQSDYPSWETLYETVFYQFAGGARGVVHEGRYQLEPFDKAVNKWTGGTHRHTAEAMLRYHFAFLRGAARHFNGFWGTSIYGQADPAIAPKALELAYDLGARYCWFWTSDHEHHVPWPEQLELARALRDHVQAHPRPSLYGPPPKRDVAIVIPNGHFLSLDNLWWVRVMDKEGKNEASRGYRRLMQRALNAIETCFQQHKDFDIVVDDGAPIKGYRRLVRVDDR